MKSIEITVARSAYYSVGVRLWYVVQSTTGERFQRWSFAMNQSDECLLICASGDILEIEYDEIHPHGDLTETVNVISKVAFKK